MKLMKSKIKLVQYIFVQALFSRLYQNLFSGLVYETAMRLTFFSQNNLQQTREGYKFY